MDPLIKKLYEIAQNSQNILIGTARPLGNGFSLINGKKCRGYANGYTIAYWDDIKKEWKV